LAPNGRESVAGQRGAPAVDGVDPTPDGREPVPSILEIRSLDGETEGCGKGRQMVGGTGIPTCFGRRDGARRRLNWQDDGGKMARLGGKMRGEACGK
jgi:hypothetical protein